MRASEVLRSTRVSSWARVPTILYTFSVEPSVLTTRSLPLTKSASTFKSRKGCEAFDPPSPVGAYAPEFPLQFKREESKERLPMQS